MNKTVFVMKIKIYLCVIFCLLAGCSQGISPRFITVTFEKNNPPPYYTTSSEELDKRAKEFIKKKAPNYNVEKWKLVSVEVDLKTDSVNLTYSTDMLPHFIVNIDKTGNPIDMMPYK